MAFFGGCGAFYVLDMLSWAWLEPSFALFTCFHLVFGLDLAFYIVFALDLAFFGVDLAFLVYVE